MDRQIIYPGQIAVETDLLNTNRNMMVSIGKLAGALLGTGGIVNGLAVSPGAGLTVSVGIGEIYQIGNVDNTAYSSLPADTTDSVVKQGIMLAAQTLACAAPATAGQSVNYLIQATYQDTDTGMVTLPYYNASNPTQAYSGPNGNGASQATRRNGSVVLNAKAGTAATTGSQVTPGVDTGYIALAVVTVANGQTTITAGNIVGVGAGINVSVKAFGAVGNGTTDDTAAFQRAYSSGASHIHCPAGTYNLTGNLTITGNTRGILLTGDGMESTIINWTGVGMTGVDGITYTNAVAQVPFVMMDMSLVCTPNPASALVLGGNAVKVVYPAQNTVYANTVNMIRVAIRPGFTGNTWAPTSIGGWADCVNTADAGKANYTNCRFVSNINTGTTYGIALSSSTNPDYVVLTDCDFMGCHKALAVTGSSSFGGLVVKGSDFEGCNYGLDVAIASDLIQVSDCYFQCYTTGINSLARTSQIHHNRFDMVSDPRARYAPAVAQGVVLGNGTAALDGDNVSFNHFGGNATTKTAVRVTAGISQANVRFNTVGDAAAYGTAYTTGVLLDATTANNTVTGNTKVACTTLVQDNGAGNIVYGNLPLDGFMTLSGATLALNSGAGNITLGDIINLTNATATTVTAINNGFRGQRITIIAGDANSTIGVTGNIHLAGGVNFAMAANATLSLMYFAAAWHETGRTTS
jgi:hypothetical protein